MDKIVFVMRPLLAAYLSIGNTCLFRSGCYCSRTVVSSSTSMNRLPFLKVFQHFNTGELNVILLQNHDSYDFITAETQKRSIQTTTCLWKRVQRKYRPKVNAHQFQEEPEYTRKESDTERTLSYKEYALPDDLAEMRHKFSEFLPVDNLLFRHPITSKLEREDMLARRSQIEIPEFYVGSILSVTVSDPNAPGKTSRFVGICIARDTQGLRATFTLRNYIEHEGVEIRYDLYNPTIRSIEVLKLEKRLDDQLFYLRDADPSYSTIPFDMEPEPHNPAEPVPINPIIVRMKPCPWTQRWEKFYPTLKGMGKLENVPDWYYEKSRSVHHKYEKFDLMLDYRMHIPEDDQVEIWKEVKQHEDVYQERRRIEKRKKLLSKSKA